MDAISYFDILTAGDITTELLKEAEDGNFKENMQKVRSALKKFHYEEAAEILKQYVDAE